MSKWLVYYKYTDKIVKEIQILDEMLKNMNKKCLRCD